MTERIEIVGGHVTESVTSSITFTKGIDSLARPSSTGSRAAKAGAAMNIDTTHRIAPRYQIHAPEVRSA